jgi:hypothetical protein
VPGELLIPNGYGTLLRLVLHYLHVGQSVLKICEGLKEVPSCLHRPEAILVRSFMPAPL